MPWSDWQSAIEINDNNASGLISRNNVRSNSWSAYNGDVEYPPLAADQASFDTFLARLIAGGQAPLAQNYMSGYVGIASWAWSQVRQQQQFFADNHYVSNMFATVCGVNLQVGATESSFPFTGVVTPVAGGNGAPPGALINNGIEWESASATARLGDLTLLGRRLFIYSQDYDFSPVAPNYTSGGVQGHNFAPPNTVPLIIAIGPPIDSLTQGLPSLSDYTVLTRVDAPAVIGGSHAPYSTLGWPNDSLNYPTQQASPFDVTIPLSTVGAVPSGSFSLAVFPGYLEPDRRPWSVPTINNFEAQDFQVLLASATDFNFFDGGQDISVTFTTPRWRYWIPETATGGHWGVRMTS